jgi:hypothetical protein
MLKFSVSRPNMFLLRRFFFGPLLAPLLGLILGPFLGSLIIPRKVHAWNSDYAYDLPKQRRMCVRRVEGKQVEFKAIFSDEDCPKDAKRYIVVFAKEPRGALALVASTTSQKFYPPLTLKWPTAQNPTRTHLWHFTCVGLEEKDVLGSKIHLYRYLGEVTFKASQQCLDAEARALNYCQEQLKGQTLLENCAIPWGS